jgi:hypothetical protein
MSFTLQVHGDIEAWRRKLICVSKEVFSPIHRELPDMIPEITSFTSELTAIRPAGIFSANAQITISSKAMLSATHFDLNLDLRSYPTDYGGSKEAQKRCLLLNSTADPFCEVPPKFYVGKDNTPDKEICEVRTLLVRWIEQSVEKMSTAAAIERGILPEHYGVQVIRSLYFVMAHKDISAGEGSMDDLDVDRLYKDALNIFSVWAIQRYMKLVIEPLVKCLDKERADFIPRLKPLLEKMLELVTTWNSYFPHAAAEYLEVSDCIRFTEASNMVLKLLL